MTARRQAVRTYLEMTERPADLAAPPPAGTTLERDRSGDVPLWRRLYEEVGRDHHWIDRLGWSDEEVRAHLADPQLEFWVLREAGAPAGYFELRREGDGAIEIGYFGLLPACIGRGLGRYLLSAALARAWALDPTRVWVHTSSLDHGSALPNYLARGFGVWKQEVYDVPDRS